MTLTFKMFSRPSTDGTYRLCLRLGTAYGLLSNLHTFLPPKKFRWPRDTSEGYIKIYLVPFEDVLPSIPCNPDINLWKKGWKKFVERLEARYFENPTHNLSHQLQRVELPEVPPDYAPFISLVETRLAVIREVRTQVEPAVAKLLELIRDRTITEVTGEGAAAPFAQNVGRHLRVPTFLLNPAEGDYRWGCILRPGGLEVLDTGRTTDRRLDHLDYTALWQAHRLDRLEDRE